ncbi:MAG: ribonuclease III [Chromatiales bacterium 21-64-14]|nr:MAG: ribonuclease III [Chromatiales bacterium 21-64-14]HQU16533.1 ribonuclease III [Gammaproteobacteria bacterium]
MNLPVDRLESALGYRFDDPEYLAWALTHRSAGSRNNERLEFLGDAILSFVIAAELYERFAQADEGELSRLRAALVKRESLAILARNLNLGDFLALGGGELKSGGFRRESILADAMEAVFGAVYLDGGWETCRDLILRMYRERLEELPQEGVRKDPKTRLQEHLQSRRLPLPDYQVTGVSGEDHAQTFTVACGVAELGLLVEGVGRSRRKAEQAAASVALSRLGVD